MELLYQFSNQKRLLEDETVVLLSLLLDGQALLWIRTVKVYLLVVTNLTVTAQSKELSKVGSMGSKNDKWMVLLSA